MCHDRFYRPSRGPTISQKENAPEKWVRLQMDAQVEAGRPKFRLLFLVFVFPFAMFGSLLRFGLFHGLLRFGGSLGANLGAFLTPFFLQLFASQQFDEGFFSAITFLPSGTDDAQISAFTIAEAGTDSVEQFIH